MIVATVRMLADFLNDPTFGVNATIPTVTRDGTDSIPPNVVGIYDATRDARVAVGQLPTTFPAIVVAPYQVQTLESMVPTIIRYGTVHVMVTYYINKSDAVSGLTWGLYTIQAIERCIKAFMDNAQANYRVRNGIGIAGCSSMQLEPNYTPVGDTAIACGILVGFQVRDSNP